MSSLYRGLVAGGAMAVMALLSLAVPASAETAAQKQAKLEAALAKAVNAALNGPTARDLDVNGHKFHVKQAKITLEGQTTVVKGQISHVLRFRPDDQVNYTIKKRLGKVISVDIQIDRGGLTKYVTKFLGDHFGLKIYEEDMNAFIRKVAYKLSGNWESAADLMVNCIAIKAPDQFVAKLPPVVGTLQTTPKGPLGLPTSNTRQ